MISLSLALPVLRCLKCLRIFLKSLREIRYRDRGDVLALRVKYELRAEVMIPFTLKIGYTLFVCALVPIYWRQYGPANFLWFSDIALLALVPAFWLENALIASTMAVAVVFLEAIWNADFLVRLSTGKSLTGLSAYMFDPRIPWFTRALSSFHIVLPLLLLGMVYRLGYDRRAFLWQTVIALVVLPLSFLVSNPQENVNWVYGFGQKPQTILPPPLFVIILMLLFPIAVYLPTHLLFARIFRAAGS